MLPLLEVAKGFLESADFADCFSTHLNLRTSAKSADEFSS